MKFRLVENIDGSGYPNHQIRDFMLQSLNTEQIINLINAKPTQTMDETSPMFILPDGRFISVKQVYKDNEHSSNEYLIHRLLAEEIAYKLLDVLAQEQEQLRDEIQLSKHYYVSDYADTIFEYLTNDLGWARINCGNQFTNGQFYCVLGNKFYPSQMLSLFDWLDWGYKNGKDDVLVYSADGNISRYYYFSDYTPDEIIKKIKRFYSSGILCEDIQDKYYRFEVIDEYGENKGGIFRGLNMLIKQLWDEDNYLYDDLNNPISELEYLTPCPKNINDAKTIFAYKEKFYNENKELISDINYVLNELGWKLKTIKMNRPTNIVYEDEVQIGYIIAKYDNEFEAVK